MNLCCTLIVGHRAKNMDKDSANAWGKNDDGTVNTSGPRVVVGDGNMGPQGGYVTKYERRTYYSIITKKLKNHSVYSRICARTQNLNILLYFIRTVTTNDIHSRYCSYSWSRT